MISEVVVKAIKEFIPEENVFLDEPMSAHTTFKVGGPADGFVEPETDGQLCNICKYLSRIGMPFFILGNGSNTLVRDEGYRGVVVHIGSRYADVRVEGDTVVAKAGARLSQVAQAAYGHGLSGMEFAAGIPGTIGGAVVMNAGAYGGEMKDIVTKVTVFSMEGEKLNLDNAAMGFGYRCSNIKNRPFAVSEVTLKLKQGEKEEIKAYMDDLVARRRSRQPLQYPSAGSTFKRPEGHFAGELIMKAGLKGYQVGGARVSEKHCGFVINAGDATAADVLAVIREVQEQVREKFQVTLEPEIVILPEN